MERMCPLQYSVRNFYLSRVTLSQDSRLIRGSLVLYPLDIFHEEFTKRRKITGLGESGEQVDLRHKRSLIGLCDFGIAGLLVYNGIWYIANKLESHSMEINVRTLPVYCSCQTAVSRIFVRMITLKFPTLCLSVMNNLIGIREFNYIWVIGRECVYTMCVFKI